MAADFAPWGRPLAPVTADGLTLNAVLSEVASARGHAILLQGRTEFVEKYAGVAAALNQRGLSVAALDWRGQGSSPRLLDDAMLGHVSDFAAYRADLDALLALPEVAALPGPRLLVAHSMGGAIALDWLRRGGANTVWGLVLSAPMLGLKLAAPLRWLAPKLAGLAVKAGLAERYAPGGGAAPYVASGFEDNVLTGDASSFNALADYLRVHPQVALGGPSHGWLKAAFDVMADLDGLTPPVPTLALLGSQEALVSPDAIRALAARPGGRLAVIDGARHEPFIETAARRAAVWSAIDSFLADMVP